LGRRKEDHQLGEALCATIIAISENIGHPWKPVEKSIDGPTEKVFRRVRLSKTGDSKGKESEPLEGWEENIPSVGNIYRVFKDNGGVIRTSIVTKISAGYIQTQNSLYRLEVIDGETRVQEED
jgi:hypothetical protein